MTSSLPNEYTEVELPLINQLTQMGWTHIQGSKWEPAASDRESFRDVVLSSHLRNALRRINVDDDGNEWLDESRIAQAEAALLRVPALKLIEANEEVTSLLLTGTTVDGVEGRDGGRGQAVHYIDWGHPEQNEFLAINQFRVDEPGGQAHKYVVPDIALFVNGIPLVVIECKSPYITEPAVEAIDQLQRYANQRARIHDDEGNERLFHFNQFVVATYFDKAMVGTFTSEGEHFAEWKETEPILREAVAAELGRAPDELSSQEILVAGLLRPAHLLDIVRNFTLQMPIKGRTVKIVGRYQQFRAVHRSIERLITGKTRVEDGEFDRRGGIVWHTQGSGKSLTMVFLIRKMRTIPELRRFKVVVVTDRTDLQRQLGETAALTGETVQVARSVAKAKDLLAQPGPGLVFAMIQKYRETDSDLAGETKGTKSSPEEKEAFGLLNENDAIVVLVDEAHRSHSSNLHANLLSALPNCARIGFTGTPIIMGEKKRTHEIFGEFIDTYTIRESEADGATVPILYEGRTTKGAVTEGRDLDEVFEDMFSERSAEELDAIKRRWATQGNVLEAPRMIEAAPLRRQRDAQPVQGPGRHHQPAGGGAVSRSIPGRPRRVGRRNRKTRPIANDSRGDRPRRRAADQTCPPRPSLTRPTSDQGTGLRAGHLRRTQRRSVVASVVRRRQTPDEHRCIQASARDRVADRAGECLTHRVSDREVDAADRLRRPG